MYTVYDIYDCPMGYFDTEARAEGYAQYLATVNEEAYIRHEPLRCVIDTDEGGRVLKNERSPYHGTDQYQNG